MKWKMNTDYLLASREERFGIFLSYIHLEYIENFFIDSDLATFHLVP